MEENERKDETTTTSDTPGTTIPPAETNTSDQGDGASQESQPEDGSADKPAA